MNEGKQAVVVSDLVVAEFNYIASTAFQANEDRARVTQFYLVTVGTFIAALFGSQLENVDRQQLYAAFGIAFALIYLLGGLTTYQLVRLRRSWYESIQAMNQIKAAAARQQPALADFFRWSADSQPPLFKPASLGFVLALMVALFSGLALGAAFAFGQLALGAAGISWLWDILTGALGAALIVTLVYWLPLRG